MAMPIEFMRGILGLLCVFFAHMLGRSIAAARAGRLKHSRVYAWTLRTLLCGAALLFRHSFDAVVIVVYALAVALLAVGWWAEQRPKHTEDLTRQIFPGE